MISRCPIAFEDESLVIVDKPEGFLSHPNPGSPSRRTAFEGRYHAEDRRFDTPGGPVWLIHRLDQDTSGLLLAAKSPEVAETCRKAFESKSIQKTYAALVLGRFPRPDGVWKDHLEKQRVQGAVRSVVRKGRLPNAELRYHVPSTGRGVDWTFLEIVLITGKTHQIRVQAASRGHPVAGDRIYGNFHMNRRIRQEQGLDRLFLHASRLRFPHPLKGMEMTVEAPLPEHLSQILKKSAL